MSLKSFFLRYSNQLLKKKLISFGLHGTNWLRNQMQKKSPSLLKLKMKTTGMVLPTLTYTILVQVFQKESITKSKSLNVQPLDSVILTTSSLELWMLSEANRLLLKLKSTDEYCYILFSAFNKFAEEPKYCSLKIGLSIRLIRLITATFQSH